MIEFRDTLAYRMWVLVVAILVAANLILLAFHLSETNAISSGVDPGLGSAAAGQSVVAKRLAVAGSRFRHDLSLTGHTIGRGGQSVVEAAGRTVSFTGRTGAASAAFALRGIRGNLELLDRAARAPAYLGKLVPRTVNLNGYIQPAAEARLVVPVITPVAVAETLPVASHVTPPVAAILPAAAPQWPIHGAITTLFGVPELPYERIHTGLDISDGKAAGVTPILPFKPGQVVEVVHSGAGLGNHVVVDHGGGLTSVYGHMSSIAVQPGQTVNEATVLGYEGATGAATGVHLHFEIRVNTQPMNPQRFISGHP